MLEFLAWKRISNVDGYRFIESDNAFWYSNFSTSTLSHSTRNRRMSFDNFCCNRKIPEYVRFMLFGSLYKHLKCNLFRFLAVLKFLKYTNLGKYRGIILNCRKFTNLFSFLCRTYSRIYLIRVQKNLIWKILSSNRAMYWYS